MNTVMVITNKQEYERLNLTSCKSQRAVVVRELISTDAFHYKQTERYQSYCIQRTTLSKGHLHHA